MGNCISFVGHLGQDAEIKQVGEGSVLEFRIANNVGFGERKNTIWFRCTIWGKRAQTLEPMLRKGKQVYVRGELNLRTYTDKNGVERTSAEVKVDDLDLLGGGDRAAEGGMGGGRPARMESSGAPASAPASPATDEDVPF